MSLNVLWGMGYEDYDSVRDELIAALKKEDTALTICEKYNRKGIVTELRSSETKYHLVIINEKIEKIPFALSTLEDLVDSNGDTNFVFCLDKKHYGSPIASSLINLSVFNCLFIDDLTADKILSLYKHPRKRAEAKLYLGVASSALEKGELVDRDTVARVIYNITRKEGEDRKEILRSTFESFTDDECLYIVSFFSSPLIEEMAGEPIIQAYLQSRKKVSEEPAAGPTASKEKKVENKKAEETVSAEKKLDIDGDEPTYVMTRREYVAVNKVFSKQMACVFNCPEFAAELADVASKKSDLTYLLIDADTLNATMDAYLNVKKYPENIRAYDNVLNNTGFNICMDAAAKNILTREVFLESLIKKDKNFYIMTGNYIIDNFEYYGEEAFNEVLERAYELFDFVIISTNAFIYDAFTVRAMMKSTINIVPVRADMVVLREYNKYLVRLKQKFNIPLEKSKFVAYEYKPGVNLSESVIKELTQGNYIGAVSYSEKRETYRNLKASFTKHITKSNNKEILQQYKDILAYFKITTKRSFWDKIMPHPKIKRLRRKKVRKCR